MIASLLQPELHELIRDKQWADLRDAVRDLDVADIAELLGDVEPDDQAAIFRLLPRDLAGRVFAHLALDRQEALLRVLSGE